MAKYEEKLLILAMQGLIYHSVASMLYNIFSEKTLQSNMGLLSLYIPLLIFALVREKCTNFFIFMLLHIAVCGSYLLIISEMELRIIMLACVFIMALSSILTKLRPVYVRDESPSAVFVVVFAAVYLSAYSTNRPVVMQISYYEAFLFVIFFVILRSFKNTANFIKVNDGIENMPAGAIRRMSRMLLAIFVLFLIAGMVLIQYMPMDEMVQAAGIVLRNLIRAVILIIIRLFSGKEETVEESGPVGKGEMPSLEGGEASVFWQMLNHIMIAVFYIALAAAAVYLIARLFYKLYIRFYEQQKDLKDESEFLWKSPLEKEHIGKIRLKTNRWNGGSSDQKIRFLYKKYIRNNAGRNTVIPYIMTPSELEIFVKKINFGKNKKEKDEIEKEEIEKEMQNDAEKLKEALWSFGKKLNEKEEIADSNKKSGGKSSLNRKAKLESFYKMNHKKEEMADLLEDGRQHENAANVDEQMQIRIGLYEKARYSKHECSRKEVEVMKQSIKSPKV